MKRFLGLMVAVLVSLPMAVGAFEPDDAMLKDYIGLTKALKANGIDPVHTNWHAIDPMCVGLMTERDKVPFNRCRFTAAVNQSDYVDDRRSCNADSVTLYPDSMARAAELPSASTVIANSGSGSVAAVVGTTQPSVTLMELRALRRATFASCMRDLGWKNPNSWQRGRIEQE